MAHLLFGLVVPPRCVASPETALPCRRMLPRVRVPVVFQRLPDGAVIFDPESECYFGLNPVGARVWELLTETPSLDDLCRALCAEHPEADPALVRQDVADLLGELSGQGLLVAAATEGGRDEAV